jgi:hypothetical protein
MNGIYIDAYNPILKHYIDSSTQAPMPCIKENQFHNTLISSTLHNRHAKCKYTFNRINNILYSLKVSHEKRIQAMRKFRAD